jgi:phosphoglucosamine mutase
VTRSLFGTDGIRGRANVAPMTPEMALRLGRAVTFVARKHGRKTPRIVIGKDTRLSGYMLEQAMAAGICSMGGHVLITGPIPTPAVANLTHSMRADAGIVISASHNPYWDNGIKIFARDGFKLPDEQELEIENLLRSPELDKGPTGARIGGATRIDDAIGRYVVFAKATFPADLSLDGLRIVVDAAHGAAYKVAPAVLRELGAEVIALGVRPNGQNINQKSGALHPEYVQKEVVRKEAHLGIALDGDADRVILVDEKGKVVDGDAVMAIAALRMLKDDRLHKSTLVTTVMSNMGLEQALDRAGGKLLRTQVGDRYVVEAMRKGGYNFGGEQSGHLIFLDHATTGDGTVAALQALGVMLREQKPMSELARCMERFPQILEGYTFPRRLPLDQMANLQKAMRAAEQTLGKEGRIVVRWSGTEPKLRLMGESTDETKLRNIMAELRAAAEIDLR